MTREFRITTEDIVGASEEDCFLDPDDPARAFMGPVGAIGAEARLAHYNSLRRETILAERENSPEMKYAREHGIKPGTPAWNTLWGTK